MQSNSKYLSTCQRLQTYLLLSRCPNALLDLIDLLNSFSEICKKLRMEYHTRTGRQFFKRIDNFNRRRTLLLITLAMYDDLTSQWHEPNGLLPSGGRLFLVWMISAFVIAYCTRICQLHDNNCIRKYQLRDSYNSCFSLSIQ